MGEAYTVERNAQILIYLLKARGIRKIVISPGATNINFVYSVQNDPCFELYSVIDERSAAYFACGLAAETGETVVLSCTGATASRNYLPGLTEAYYRKLPIIAVTSSQLNSRIGHNLPQLTDRTQPMRDTVKASATLPIVRCAEDEWFCEVKANELILESRHRGCGPVHINLETEYRNDFSVGVLPKVRVMHRIERNQQLPQMPHGKIGIFCAEHSVWECELTKAVDAFCEHHNAVVLHDLSSNYKGKYGVLSPMVLRQENPRKETQFDLLIHIGNVSAAYVPIDAKEVWRVNPDGVLRDTFRKLTYVFEMDEMEFFTHYLIGRSNGDSQFAKDWQGEYLKLYEKIGELPFSNLWLAYTTAAKLRDNMVLHLGILSSFRAWTFFPVDDAVNVFCNIGGFGIDGCISTMIGASQSNPKKIYLGVVGDLACYYDLNSLGNRHVGGNVRLLVVNNRKGAEFTLPGMSMEYRGVEHADPYIAAAGHYGDKAAPVLKNYAEALGFRYFGINNKDDYLTVLPQLLCRETGTKPLLVECFTECQNECDALKQMYTLNGRSAACQVKKHSVYVSDRMKKMAQESTLVLWGTGDCFSRNLKAVEAVQKVEIVTCNSREKWGEEIVPGIRCIAPEELKTLSDVQVVIMVEDTGSCFQIANQLLDLGITNFDHIYNWLSYQKKEKKP